MKRSPRIKTPEELSPEALLSRERGYLMWLLARRDYPRKKLEQKLRLRGIAPPLIKEILDQLEEQKYFQPASFTKTRSRTLARKGFSSEGISRRLREDGISESPAAVTSLLESQGVGIDDGLRDLIDKGQRQLGSEITPAFIRKCLARGHRYAAVIKMWKDRLDQASLG